METSWILCSILDWMHNLNSIFHPWGVSATTDTQQSNALLHKCPWKSDRKCKAVWLQVLKPHPSPRVVSTQAALLLPWWADCLGCCSDYQGLALLNSQGTKNITSPLMVCNDNSRNSIQPSMYIYFPSDVCGGSGIIVFSHVEDENASVDTDLRGTGGWHLQHVLHGTNPECFRGSSGGSMGLEMPKAAAGGVQTFSPGCSTVPRVWTSLSCRYS